jgi:hypothetical protein
MIDKLFAVLCALVLNGVLAAAAPAQTPAPHPHPPGLAPLPVVSSAWGFTLVTAAEYQQLKTGNPGDTQFRKDVPTQEPKVLDLDVPLIVVQSPDPHAVIRPPLRLELRFKPAPAAQIDTTSFQVIYKYGPLRKDITDRILPFVKVTSDGVTGTSAAAIPAGEHTLILRIRDSQKRTGEQVVTFRVGDAA